MESSTHYFPKSFFSLALFLLLPLLFPPSLFAQPESLPTRFDLRDVDGTAYIGPVKNQNPLGSCYSFAATATAESTYNKAQADYNGNPVSLSESFIIWSLSQKYKGFYGGDGSSYDYDELQAMVDYGDCTEEEFPYTSDGDVIKAYENDTDHELDYHWDAPRIKFAGVHRLPTNDIETIKRAIITFGAVDAAVDVTDDFHAYTDGIFPDNATTASNPLEYFTGTNHAISLVGWDDNSTGEGEGAWILRNSWGENWGEDGYMRIGYTSARVATSACYLHYKEWNEHGFGHIDSVNNGTITGELNATGYRPVARGVYEWGDDTSSMVNNETITANATVDRGDPYVHGMFLWAGNASRIENNDVINATASTNRGQATAYGICLQGHEMTNTGTITVNAISGDDRATAYGARFFSFDENGTFENNGTISALAEGDDGWAYGLLSTDAATILNTGNMTAKGSGYAISILAEGPSLVSNQGTLNASTTTGKANGIAVYSGSAINDCNILTQASGSNATTVGIYGEGANQILNNHTITSQANAANGTSYGIYSFGSTACINNGTITTQADLKSVGIQSSGSESVSNTGTINATATDSAQGITSIRETLVSNHGTITAISSGTGGETYGIMAYSTKTVSNTETITAAATDTDGTAYGITALNTDTVTNTGTINATASRAQGISASGDGLVTNNGTIVATAATEQACGVDLTDGTLINNSSGTIVATTTNGTARALNLVDAKATNAGTIRANGPADAGIYAVYLSASKLLNNGVVRGDTFVGEESILGGYGSFNGTVTNDAGTVAPGNSIGTLTINGDYVQS
ncbi:C1 family peptidase, partial [Desulfoplanes sp.]